MRYKLLALRLIALFALAVCGAILNDYLLTGPAICGFQSGCDSVMFSPYGRPLGIPLPLVGLIGFGSFFGLTLFPERRAFTLLRPLAVTAGLIGVALILIQVVALQQVCPLCLLVDLSGIALAGIALAGRLPQGAVAPSSWPVRAAWLWAGLLAVATPPLGAWIRSLRPVPEEVKAHWVQGKINVVEVMDFDCPNCQEAEPVVVAFRKELGERGHFVRLPVATPQHPTARAAARAYLAAAAQGKGEAMASALLATPSHEPEECRRLARALQLNLKEYDRTVKDPALEKQIDATVAWAAASAPGLPVIWVQDQRVTGIPTPEKLREALARAEHSAANQP